MNKLDDDIEIIKEYNDYKKDFNVGDTKTYNLIGKTTDGENIHVKMDFNNASKSNDFYITTDYADVVLNNVILNKIKEHSNFDYVQFFINNELNDVENKNTNRFSISIEYYAYEEKDGEINSNYTFINENELIENAENNGMKLKAYIEENYEEVIQKQNIDKISIDFNNYYGTTSENYYGTPFENYYKNKITEDELNLMIDDTLTFYQSFNKEFPNTDLYLEFYNDIYLDTTEMNDINLNEEKERILNEFKFQKDNKKGNN